MTDPNDTPTFSADVPGDLGPGLVIETPTTEPRPLENPADIPHARRFTDAERIEAARIAHEADLPFPRESLASLDDAHPTAVTPLSGMAECARLEAEILSLRTDNARLVDEITKYREAMAKHSVGYRCTPRPGALVSG